jgi:hypothetical protein
MYRVVKAFPERHDQNFQYESGDSYPREGFTPPPGRADALCADLISPENRTGQIYLSVETEDLPKPRKSVKSKRV